jgi:hypothetical protein
MMSREVDRDERGAEASLDAVLDRLARVISDRTGASPDSDGGAEPDNNQPVPTPSVGYDALERLEWFAREHRFFEALPPMNPQLEDEIDRLLGSLPEFIKSLANRPGLRERFRSAAAMGRGAGAERSSLPAPLAALIARAAAETEAARVRH